eukprot:6404614-Amphidinium_carterae.1
MGIFAVSSGDFWVRDGGTSSGPCRVFLRHGSGWEFDNSLAVVARPRQNRGRALSNLGIAMTRARNGYLSAQTKS